ncbi:MAG: O-antigen ligase family protein, partial [Bacillota bacterium]
EKWLQSGLVRRGMWVSLYLVAAFPLVDYGLRYVFPVPVLGALWDEVVIVFLSLCVATRLLFGARIPRFLSSLLPLLALSAAYLVADLDSPGITVEGLRAALQFIPFFFIGYFLIDRREGARGLLRLIALVATVVALLGVIQVATGVQTPAGWADVGETLTVRIFSIVQSPNVLGSHMALAVPLLLGLACCEGSRGLRIGWLAAAALCCLALLLTFSRGAWLALAGAVLVVTFIINRRVFAALLIAVVVLGVGIPEIRTRILSVFSEEYLAKSMLDGRLGRWLRAYDQLRSRPLFGLGPGRYGGAVAARALGVSYVDNYYVKTAAELGLVGLGAFLLWLGAALGRGYASWRRLSGSREGYLAAGLFCALLAVALHNGVENILEVPYMSTYFWLVGGVLAAYPRLNGSGEDEGVRLRLSLPPGGFLERAQLLRIAGWLAAGLFAVLFYHLIVVPGLLDYSHYALTALVAGGVGSVYLLRPGERRGVITFVLAVLFSVEALESIHSWSLAAEIGGTVVILAVISAVAGIYGRLHASQLAAVVLAAVLIMSAASVDEMRLWNNHWLLWESPALYGGEVFPYFPLRTGDITGDGRAEIVTWGNAEETPPGEEEDEVQVLRPEKVYLYVFAWDGRRFSRLPPGDLTADELERAHRLVRDHYPGFPYYRLTREGLLLPGVSTEQLVDAALDFGRVTEMVTGLNREVVEGRVADLEGLVDEAAYPGLGLDSVRLSGGQLEVDLESGETVVFSTDASKIIAPLSLEGGTALAVLGSSLELVSVSPDGLTLSHRLSEDQVPAVGLSEFIVGDVTGDGLDEVLLSSNRGPARILRPGPGGSWQLLWAAREDDDSFRFETVVPGDPPLIIALDPSRVRGDPLRYLSGYHLTDGGLTSAWRTMTTLVDVSMADVTGDGDREIIGGRYGRHQFWVLRNHRLPVNGILWAVAGLIVTCLIWRRQREVSR